MSGPLPNLYRFCAIAALVAIAACTTPPSRRRQPPARAAAAHGPGGRAIPWTSDQPTYLRLPNMAADAVPVRVGVILPFSSSHRRDPRAGRVDDEGGGTGAVRFRQPEHPADDRRRRQGGAGTAAAAAQQLLAQGAEVIVGPLFGPSVSAVAAASRATAACRCWPSPPRRTRGRQWRLSAELPAAERSRAAWSVMPPRNGHHQFAALVPQTAYGDVAKDAFARCRGRRAWRQSWMSSISRPMPAP